MTDQRDRAAPRSGSSRGGSGTAVDWLVELTRAGWLAKGFVFVVIGALAIRIAVDGMAGGDGSVGRRGPNADQGGALRAISDTGMGGVLLVLLAVGLVVFAVWNVTQAVIPDSADANLLGVCRRIGWAGLGAFYGLIGWAAWSLATGDGSRPTGGATSGDAGDTATALTARLMGAPGGRLLVAAVGVVVLAVAAFHLHKGVTFGFVDDLDTDDLSDRTETRIGWFGVAGFVARALVLAVAGWFLLRAAIQFDPTEAVGLDGALRELATVALGRLLLLVTGGGLLLAGVYDMVTFRRQTMR